jgi:alkylhydroperoxidase/carboxymuconolactone decarboxylase family protein YurZ
LTATPWPSAQQRRHVETLEQYHPEVYAAWSDRLQTSLERKQLDVRSEEVLVSGLVAVLHFSPDVVERHIEAALDAGSNVAELLETMIRAGDQEGQHALSSGGEALWSVVHRREAAGVSTPRRGPELGPEDLIPHSPWTPVLFPYHTPRPRHWQQAITKFLPERAAIDAKAAVERQALPVQLSRRLTEVFDTAVDVVVRWKAPRVDHHLHEALNCGSSVRELLETFMVYAEVAQGARESNISGRQVESGPEILRYGLAALDRVISERDGVGRRTPRDQSERFMSASD